jgi:hypothetical protein
LLQLLLDHLVMVAVSSSGGADSANTDGGERQEHQQQQQEQQPSQEDQNHENGIKRRSLSGALHGDSSFGNLDALDDLVSLDSDVAMSTESSSQRQIPGQQHHPCGGRQSSAHSNNSSGHPNNPVVHYNPIGLTIGEALSPAAYARQTGMPYPTTSYHNNTSSHHLGPPVVNAVHMHVQENSKVSTLNLPVDRSNSSHRAYFGGGTTSQATKNDIDEMIINLETDNSNTNDYRSRSNSLIDDTTLAPSTPGNFSLAELFLSKESSQRRSLDLNYDNFGAVLMDFGFGGGDQSRQHSNGFNSASCPLSSGGGVQNGNQGSTANINNDEDQMEIDALTAGIDPTPLSEIREKIKLRTQYSASNGDDNSNFKYDQGQGREKGKTAAGSKSHNSQHHHIATDNPHHYNYYPYGRQFQLPIPQKIPSPPRGPMPAPVLPILDSVVAEAVATAAALASTGYTTTATATTTSKTATDLPPPPSRQVSTSSSSIHMASNASTHQHIHLIRHPTPTVSNTAMPYTQAQQSTTKTTQLTTSTSPSSSSTMNSKTLNSAPSASTEMMRPYQRYQGPSYTSQDHADAHTASRGSVVSAANQKSQYGFGGNHMVPSVPGPQPSMGSNKNPMHGSKRPNGLSISSITPPPPPSTLPPSSTHTSPSSSSPIPPVYAGAAYERKKQRAKDARVKLNDAIERLAISMTLAGSQSKQRAEQLRATGISASFHGGTKNHGGINNQYNTIRLKTLQAMEECFREAESSKKWDRPDFVGTASNIIHTLNSQCEGLVNELIALQEALENATAGGTFSKPLTEGNESTVLPGAGSGNNNNNNNNTSDSTSHPDHKRHIAPSSSEGDVELEGELSPANKRRRSVTMGDSARGVENGTSPGQSTGTAIRPTPPRVLGSNTTEEQTVLDLVSKVLDPASLCRCPCVSRSWRGAVAFQKDQTWLELSVKRFGFYNVRQWTEKMSDGDHQVNMKTLYRAMNSANVMPHIQQEGILLLGGAKIPGRVSGWAFLVERSNGETLRSVMREDPTTASTVDPGGTVSFRGSGAYLSLPVVELRIIIQNIGMGTGPVILKDQQVSVDVSTRRSGGELIEIHCDERFAKEVTELDGSVRSRPPPTTNRQSSFGMQRELCRLDLFEAAVLKVHIHAKGCSTISRFQQRSNFTKVLACLDGTTVPLVIPFLRDANTSQI